MCVGCVCVVCAYVGVGFTTDVFNLLPGSIGSGPQYVHSTVGLFPGKIYKQFLLFGFIKTFVLAPLGSCTEFRVVEEVCNRFRTLGKLIAKSLMDSRIVCFKTVA